MPSFEPTYTTLVRVATDAAHVGYWFRLPLVAVFSGKYTGAAAVYRESLSAVEMVPVGGPTQVGLESTMSPSTDARARKNVCTVAPLAGVTGKDVPPVSLVREPR